MEPEKEDERTGEHPPSVLLMWTLVGGSTTHFGAVAVVAAVGSLHLVLFYMRTIKARESAV